MTKRDYPKKFKDNLEVAGRSYSRWSVTGTFGTTDNAVEKYKNDFYLDGDIVRWKSNDQIPFGDMLLDFCEAGLVSPKQLRLSCEIRENETDEFWKKYFNKETA